MATTTQAQVQFPIKFLALNGWYSRPYYTLEETEFMSTDRRQRWIVAMIERIELVKESTFVNHGSAYPGTVGQDLYKWSIPQLMKIMCGEDPLSRELITLELIKRDITSPREIDEMNRTSLRIPHGLFTGDETECHMLLEPPRYHDFTYSAQWFASNVGKQPPWSKLSQDHYTAHADASALKINVKKVPRSIVKHESPVSTSTSVRKRKRTAERVTVDLTSLDDSDDLTAEPLIPHESILRREQRKYIVEDWKCVKSTRPFNPVIKADIELLKQYEKLHDVTVSAVELLDEGAT